MVLGGYGGAGTHMRRADVLVYDPLAVTAPPAPVTAASSQPSAGQPVVTGAGGSPAGSWSLISHEASAAPCPRMGHAAALLGGWRPQFMHASGGDDLHVLGALWFRPPRASLPPVIYASSLNFHVPQPPLPR